MHSCWMIPPLHRSALAALYSCCRLTHGYTLDMHGSERTGLGWRGALEETGCIACERSSG